MYLPSRLTPGGKVYELVSSSEAEGGIVYLVALSEKFDYGWSTQIQLPHPFASVFLALPTGDFLIAGVLDEGNRQRLPFAGIYGSDGQLKYQLDLAKPSGMAADDPKYADSTPAVMGMPFGGDGNIYLLRQGSPPEVYVISQLGKLIRTFQPQLPFEGARAGDLYAAQNRILIVYHSPEPAKGEPKVQRKTIFALYDMYEGRPIANYVAPADGMPMCFDGVEMTFLRTSRDGHFSIARAQLR